MKLNDPLSLTLAADARLVKTDYFDDQIWGFNIGGGEPPALALQTTYGLRARSMRLFPRFSEGDLTRTDPNTFVQTPIITQLYPNFLATTFSPLPDIDVDAEYWVPQSHVVAGRLQISNNSKNERQIQFEWIAQLAPDEGQPMAAIEIQAAYVLSGRTGNLSPVVFLTGGSKAGTGSYPSLIQTLDLAPGSSQQFLWAHAALAEPEESMQLARDTIACNWDAERSRVEMLNAGLLDIYTGEEDWDITFMLAQKLALGLFVGPTAQLPHPSYVLTRQPDQGYSLSGNGSDYNHLWNGQSPLEAYYLAIQVVQTAPELASGLLKNFLVDQTENGFLDWKPGLGGQRSRLLATPILCDLAWRIFEINEDKTSLEDTYSTLLRFIQAWFAPDHDRDQDGIPEWDHPMQTGTEDHPLYAHWHEFSRGIEITTAESPSLNAFLYRECSTMIKIAETIGHTEDIPELQNLANNLSKAIQTSWDSETSSYYDRDRDTHFSTDSDWLGGIIGPGIIQIERQFEFPVRLIMQILASNESNRRPQIFIHGTSASGRHRIERIEDSQIRWFMNQGNLTTERVYASLAQIEVRDLEADDQITIYTAGYKSTDQTTLAPLWAGVPDSQYAALLITETITNPDKFWHKFGLPACPHTQEEYDSTVCQNTNLPWDTLVGEGLIRYGYRDQAAELVTKLMSAIIQTLKKDHAFRRFYNTDTGEGVGEYNALNGIAPLSLFLETLGIRFISPHKITLAGYNPFPWPITVKYRGTTVLRQKEKTIIVFPDGQTVSVEDPEPRTIMLETEPAEDQVSQNEK